MLLSWATSGAARFDASRLTDDTRRLDIAALHPQPDHTAGPSFAAGEMIEMKESRSSTPYLAIAHTARQVRTIRRRAI